MPHKAIAGFSSHFSRIARSLGPLSVKTMPIPVGVTFAVTLPTGGSLDSKSSNRIIPTSGDRRFLYLRLGLRLGNSVPTPGAEPFRAALRSKDGQG